MKINTKGHVTIPQEIRERLGLLPHTEVDFEVRDDVVVLKLGAVAPLEALEDRQMVAGTEPFYSRALMLGWGAGGSAGEDGPYLWGRGRWQVLALVRQPLLDEALRGPALDGSLEELVRDVAEHRLAPYTAATRLIAN